MSSHPGLQSGQQAMTRPQLGVYQESFSIKCGFVIAEAFVQVFIVYLSKRNEWHGNRTVGAIITNA